VGEATRQIKVGTWIATASICATPTPAPRRPA
jgi:hypothetical protein